MRFALLVLLATAPAWAQARFCRIELVDAVDGSPVAGARLETVNHLRFVSDVNGLVAFHEPGLMGSKVFFTVERSGYQLPPDGLGIRGVALTVNEGGTARISLPRAPGLDAGPVPVVGAGDSRLLDGGARVPDAGRFLRVDAVDAETGRGVPLVFVETPYGQFITDSAGVAALFHPDAEGKTVPVSVWSYGYDAPDGGAVRLTFGGGQVTLPMKRRLPAERLTRLTGGGAFRDSTLLGLPVPRARPNLAGRVLGQDSVLSTVHRGRAFFIWGDTNRPDSPLGNFFSTGATAALPGDGGRKAEQGLDLEYFVDPASGFVKPMAPFDPAPQPIWLSALASVKDRDGGEALFAAFAKVRGDFSLARQGVVRWNEAQSQFDLVLDLPVDGGAPLTLDGHPVPWLQSDGGAWLYFPPALRIPASGEGYSTPSEWEAFTLPRSDAGYRALADGGFPYAFAAGLARVEVDAAARGLVARRGSLTEQALEAPSGRPFSTHPNDSVAWNASRGRFIRFASERFFVLGDLFFQEADTPMGPWVWSRRVATHEGYTFYNPRQHPFLDEDGGRVVFFEGTYTAWLSAAQPTARYDYNQLLYRLDLTDPRLSLPVPVYPAGLPVTKADVPAEARSLVPSFYAYDAPGPGRVPVSVASVCSGALTTRDAGTTPLFYGAPADAGGAVLLPLDAGAPVYGFPNPLDVAFPVAAFRSQGISLAAGPDRCVTAGPLVLTSTVEAASPPVTVAWSMDGRPPEYGESASFVVEPGLHELQVVAVDARGHRASDRVLVEAFAAAGGGNGGGGSSGGSAGGGSGGGGSSGGSAGGGSGGGGAAVMPGCACGPGGSGVEAAVGLLGALFLRRRRR